MKRTVSLLLAIAMATGIVSGCVHQDPPRPSETESSSRTTRLPNETTAREQPQYLTEPVDITNEFNTIYAEPVDTPWVLENNIPFSRGNTRVYFTQFVTTENYEAVVPDSEVYNSEGTVVAPIVRHYPAENPDYTVYEITYSMALPMSMYIPSGYGTNFYWRYHDVQYLDYYTGVQYPEFSMTSNVDSFCTYGDVVYNGQTYTVYHYSYREREETSAETEYVGSGRRVNITITYNITDYFIIPRGYDGIVMYIYTADDTGDSFEEVYGGNKPTYSGNTIFGDDGEIIEDYTFLNICDLG